MYLVVEGVENSNGGGRSQFGIVIVLGLVLVLE
jgi:hypothetical protein